MDNPTYTEEQIKAAHRANAHGFISQLLASGVAKNDKHAAELYKRASVITTAAQARRDFVRSKVAALIAQPA